MQNMYAVKTLKAHGMSNRILPMMSKAFIISRLSYAAPTWWGFLTAQDKDRLQGILNKCLKWGLYDRTEPNLGQLVSLHENKLFKNIIKDNCHTLHNLLPPVRTTHYNLRVRGHDRILPTKDSLLECNFISRMLYATY